MRQPLRKHASIALALAALGSSSCTKLDDPSLPADAGSSDAGEGDASETLEGPAIVGEAGAGSDDRGVVPTAEVDSGDGTTTDEGGSSPGSESCSSGGALRCAAGAAREVCMDGIWQPGDPCPRDTVCTMDDPARCPSLLTACVGHMGKSVCTGAVMQHCNDSALSAGTETCQSERLCQGGVDKGHCLKCAPGQFKCTDTRLEKCSDDGEQWLPSQTCASKALCNEAAGTCTSATCTTGQKRCSGDSLERCNASGTGFEPETTCMPGLCDQVGKECDICLPKARDCMGTSSYQVCQDSGQAYAAQACGSGAPLCTGSGACVACLTDTNCTDPGECKHATCSAGSCVASNDRLKSSCKLASGANGACDSVGNCVQCIDPGEVCSLASGGSGVCNDRNTCVQCNTAADCKNPINGCQERQCSATGTCSARARVGETCTTGRCNSSAQCVECVDSNTCPSAAPYCVNDACKQCRSDADCGSAKLQCKNNMCTNRCGNGVVERSNGEDCEANVGGFTATNCLLCREAVYTPSGASNCSPNQADTDALNFFGPGNCPDLPGFNETCLYIRGLGCYLACNSDSNCPVAYRCSLFAGTSFEGFNPPFAGYCQ